MIIQAIYEVSTFLGFWVLLAMVFGTISAGVNRIIKRYKRRAAILARIRAAQEHRDNVRRFYRNEYEVKN